MHLPMAGVQGSQTLPAAAGRMSKTGRHLVRARPLLSPGHNGTPPPTLTAKNQPHAREAVEAWPPHLSQQPLRMLLTR